MASYTQIPVDVAQTLQMNAGIIAKTFTPSTGVVADIIGATTGGITITATPSYTDNGADIDNCPKNSKEMKQLDSWECKVSGTYLTITAAKMAALLGAADVDGDDATHVVLNSTLASGDFSDVWFIGDYGASGFLAVKLSDALNTTGLSIRTSDKAKGQIAFEYLGHTSIAAPTVVPLDIYIKDSVALGVTYSLTACSRTLGGDFVATGTDLVARFVADAGKALPASVTVTEGGSALSSGSDYTWTQGTGVLVVPAAAGALVITVTAA